MKDSAESLSSKMEGLIAALLSHSSIEDAAKSIGVVASTAWRWMQKPEFQAAYKEARRESMRQVTARLQVASREAVDCLREVQRDGASESARVAASRTVLEFSLKATDLEAIQERLDALEQAIAAVRRDFRASQNTPRRVAHGAYRCPHGGSQAPTVDQLLMR
jgi:hypothetical protein